MTNPGKNMKEKNKMRGESCDLTASLNYVYWHQTRCEFKYFGFLNSFFFSVL